MADRTAPLEQDEFARFPPLPDGRSARLDISGIAVEIEGLPDDLAGAMRQRYAPYIGDATAAGEPLRLRLVGAPLDSFVPPGFTQRKEDYRVLTAFDGRIFRFTSYRMAAWFDLDRRVGQVAVARGDLDPVPRAMENVLRSAVAWLAMDTGGFLLHGASIVRD